MNPTRSCARSLQKNGLEGKVWQYFTAVPDFRSVGVKDGARTFAYPVILRAVNTVDAMTATVEKCAVRAPRAYHSAGSQQKSRRQPRALRPHPRSPAERLSGNDFTPVKKARE